MPSVLWCSSLYGKKGIRSLKNWVMRCWRGYLFRARVKWFANGPADATAAPLSLASVKSRMVYPSGTGIPRLSWKKYCWTTVVVCFYIGIGDDSEMLVHHWSIAAQRSQLQLAVPHPGKERVHVIKMLFFFVICSDWVHAALDRAEGDAREEAGRASQRSSCTEDYEVVS